MLYDDLIRRLRDPDQWVRVETLRILAMVEETRALREIEWVYKNDPEMGVRQVAQWAGRSIMAAAKTTTGSITPVLVKQADREDALLSSLIEKDPRTYDQMQAQLLKQELLDEMRQASAAPPAPIKAEAPERPAAPPRPLDRMALLEAGLSDGFFEG
jgi:hypothetical protein